jgi:hypothetical protein
MLMNHTLIQAAATGKLVEVLEMLKRGASLDYVSRMTGDTALTSASRNGHEAVVRHLCERGAKVDLHLPNDDTALSIAGTECAPTALSIVVVSVLLLHSYCTPTALYSVLLLYSYSTPTALMLHSYCAPTALLPHSHCAPTALLPYSHRTPTALSIPATTKQVGVVSTLLAAGAAPVEAVQSPNVTTPLMIAAHSDDRQLLQVQYSLYTVLYSLLSLAAGVH